MEHRAVGFDETAIRAALSDLPLGGLRVFSSIGSTNTEALAWAKAGAPDLALVIADEQTAGRGRAGRTWLTPAGTALAFSIILRDPSTDDVPGRLAGLGALAVAEACEAQRLQPSIKWPNDVLLQRRKAAGVLVEALWYGDRLEAAILGIGINILRGSTPPADQLRYPATSLEDTLGRGVARQDVLRDTVVAILAWRPKLQTSDFIDTWRSRTAFLGEQITLSREGRPPLTGRLTGLDEKGRLILASDAGSVSVQMGEIQPQPSDDRIQ